MVKMVHITKWSQLGITHTDCPKRQNYPYQSSNLIPGLTSNFREALLGKTRDFELGFFGFTRL